MGRELTPLFAAATLALALASSPVKAEPAKTETTATGSAQAEPVLDGEAILHRARDAAGGDGWANARTLVLRGRATFYGPNGHEPTAIADDYTMWRAFDPARAAAHGAEGKVRITAKAHGKLLFEVGFDGHESWNERGVIPKDKADEFWANNFGFGIIRQAGKPGFVARRLADDTVNGHPAFIVEFDDPGGGRTLFGIDRASFAIRMVGFKTPKGWHHRIYDDFVQAEKPRWLQARSVTLYYDGRKANEVFWSEFAVNGDIDETLFNLASATPR